MASMDKFTHVFQIILIDFANFFNGYLKMADVNNGVINDRANDVYFGDFHPDSGSENDDEGWDNNILHVNIDNWQ